VCSICKGSHSKCKYSRNFRQTVSTVQPSANPKTPTTPIKSDILATELKGYNPTLYNILISGFKFGFRIGAIGTKANCNAKNQKSALDNSV
jgi:hypothetical protein